MLKLTSNKIRCKFCGDVISSVSVHDFKSCRCGKCAVDGGLEYARRVFPTGIPAYSYEDLSTYVDENGNLHTAKEVSLISAYVDENGKLHTAKEVNQKDIPTQQIQVEVKEVPDPTPDIPEVIEESKDDEPVPELIDPEEPLNERIPVNLPKWGKSKYANKDGTLTEEGKKRYFQKDEK